MVYMFKLPPELMGRLVAIREKTKKPLAQQVREAVKEYCDRVEESEGVCDVAGRAESED